jgi:hypothetical protein
MSKRLEGIVTVLFLASWLLLWCAIILASE